MSGRRLDLTQQQVRAICMGAKKAGYAAVIQAGNTLVRLIPEEHAIHEFEKQVGGSVDDKEDVGL